MQIITIAVIPIGLTGILGIQVLTAIEKEHNVLYSVIAGAVLDFLLNLVFIPSMGAAGAALATTITEFAVLIIQMIFTKELLSRVKNKLQMHKYLILSLISMVLSYGTKLLPINSLLLRLIVSALVFFVAYGIALLIAKDEFAMDTMSFIMGKIKRRNKDV